MKQKISLVSGSVLLVLLCLLLGGDSVCAASGGTISFYHAHTGSAANGGGCYGKKVSSSRECGSYSLDIWDNGQGSYNYLCKSCGNQWVYIYALSGSHCTATINETHYEINCGMGNGALATLSCTKSTDGWTKELDLQASCQVYHSNFQLSATPYVWNGTASTSGSYHVTQNGTYTLGIQASGADTSQTISVVVDHIDNQAPVIKEFAGSGGWAQSVTLWAQAEDGASGLPADAYSYDGGATWTSENSRSVSENGSYSVLVRDAAGNRASAETTVTTIDKEPPHIQIITSPAVSDWYDGNLMITVQASDAQSGLANAAYSFDGGGNFLVGNCYEISGNRDLKIVVADRAGNRTEVAFSAQKQVRPTKTSEPTKTPEPTKIAEPTKIPEPTKASELTKAPEPTRIPEPTKAPESTKALEPTKAPEPTEVPEPTKVPRRVKTPEAEKEASVMQAEATGFSGESEGVPMLGQHYPKETWQGAPIRGGGGLKEKSEVETETVVLNELLAENLTTDIHTIATEKKEKKGLMALVGIVAVIVLLIGIAARVVTCVYAKDAKERYRMVGMTICRKRDNKKKIVITDKMLRRAQTNVFRIQMPILMPLQKDAKAIVSCHGVEREIPLNRLLQIRLRSE